MMGYEMALGVPQRCILLAALLFCAYLPVPSLARMCMGTQTAMTRVGQTTEDTYNFYKNMYTGELWQMDCDPVWICPSM